VIVLTFTALGLTLFTLLIAAEEYRRLKARLRHDFEQAFGHAHPLHGRGKTQPKKQDAES
jgi:hypothetical protein